MGYRAGMGPYNEAKEAIVSNGNGSPHPAERITGKIKWFDPKKGYGFIEKTLGAEKDIFFHSNNLPEDVGELIPGQTVTFQTESSKKGVRAINMLVGK